MKWGASWIDFYIISSIFGLIVGSFLNVCIYRIPRKLSLAYPPSHCPKCQNRLKGIDLIPVLSYVIFKGRCRQCKASIPWRYLVVELICGLSFLILAYKYSFTLEFFLYSILACGLIVCSFVDIDLKIIPDEVLLFTAVAGIFLTIINTRASFLQGLIGALVGGSIFLTLAFTFKEGMGGGDIKLIAVIGFYLGWENVLLTIWAASLLVLVISPVLFIPAKRLKKAMIPFGPFLSLGAVITILWGENLLKILY